MNLLHICCNLAGSTVFPQLFTALKAAGLEQTVFVPEKDPNAGRDLSQTIALGAQVFGVLATAAALLLR